MRLFKTIAGLQTYLDVSRSGKQGWSIDGAIATPNEDVCVGLVPTMGALHDGHLSLIRRARQDNDIVVVSIFVNPLQFGPTEDFERYPKTLERDRILCEEAGVDAIFAPSVDMLYGTTHLADAALTQVMPPPSMTAVLCGPHRPGHFEGVATVVTKLFNIVQPNRAYFGQKDAQQLAILRRLVADLNMPVDIIPCPIVRESSGLAMSSRNQYLTDEERTRAIALYRGLRQAEQRCRQGHRRAAELIESVRHVLTDTPTVQVQYVELVHPETMQPLDTVDESGLLAIAAYVGSTRLIDNVILRHRQPIIAIDGPAGAGKSTVARQVAQALGLLYLDTGAMYRAVTWLALTSDIPVHDEVAIAELVSQCHLQFEQDSTQPHAIPRIWINDHDVTQAIRTPEVTANVSAIAAQPVVRRALVKQQQDYGRRGGIVMDGRDIGTHVFPDAELKIFLTASVQERARRRQLDLKHQGHPDMSLDTLEQAIFERDQKDSRRKIAPLCQAPDAIELITDGLTIDAVVNRILALYHQRLAEAAT